MNMDNKWEEACNKACQSRPAWIEVDMGILRQNFRAIRALVPAGIKLAAVVKANAYGHGAVPVAKALLAEGADRLAVATLGEALELRAAGVTADIMLLGYTGEPGLELGVAQDLILPVYSYEMGEALSRAAVKLGRRARVQLVADTGMGRIGWQTGEHGEHGEHSEHNKELAASVAEAVAVAALPGLELDGLFSHFAAADEQDLTYAEAQLAAYLRFTEALAEAGVRLPLRNLANSAGLMELAGARLDMVRAGIILYGYYPSAEVHQERLALTPALSIKARLTCVKRVAAGTAISYGCTFVTKRPSIIATVPVGYADGWRRALSNRGQVLLGGRRVPIVGRVCMDQFMVDATEVPEAAVGDEVVLLGRQGGEQIDAEELAARLDTISYEVLSALLPRLPRKYLD